MNVFFNQMGTDDKEYNKYQEIEIGRLFGAMLRKHFEIIIGSHNY